MAGADRRQLGARRADHVDDAAAGDVPGERAAGLGLDVGPGRVRDRREFAVQVVHGDGTPFQAADVQRTVVHGRRDSAATVVDGGCVGRAGSRRTSGGSSRKSAVGTKNRLPVTAVEKSRIRS